MSQNNKMALFCFRQAQPRGCVRDRGSVSGRRRFLATIEHLDIRLLFAWNYILDRGKESKRVCEPGFLCISSSRCGPFSWAEAIGFSALLFTLTCHTEYVSVDKSR